MEALEQEAFLLHSRPFKDNQLIVDLLTINDGKVSAVVYTGKSPKTNKKGLLQPFLPLKVLLKGKGQLKNLSRIESYGKSYPLVGNYVFCGFYLNELMIRLLGEHIECQELFAQYTKSLQALGEQKKQEHILRQFETVLLDELGQSFDFNSVFESNEPYFYYVLEHGFIPVIEKMSMPIYSRETLLLIAQQSFDDEETLKTFKLLMRQVINNLLGGKPLNSRKLFTR
jgi:DNA repair protein RecO (recombination protein O)